MRVADVAETLIAQINSETMNWIKLKIKALVREYRELLSTKRIYCDANDWFTVQVVDKLYEIGEIFGCYNDVLTYLFKFKEKILWGEVDIERGEIHIEYSFTKGDSKWVFALLFPHRGIVNFNCVDHKNLGETLEKLKDKVEELLPLMEKKLQEVLQIQEEILKRWRQSKIYTELLSERALKKFEKKE